jgi:hypothetical protein
MADESSFESKRMLFFFTKVGSYRLSDVKKNLTDLLV